MIRRSHALEVIIGVLAVACSEPRLLERSASPIVYGQDGRQEYYEAGESTRRLMAESVVALVPNSELERQGPAGLASAVSYGSAANLCPGERFAEQPAAAFCSGVLVDRDLVLTAGHCLRLAALKDFSVVFDYYYREPDRLVIEADAIRKPIEIPAERLDALGLEPRLDYGWLRLDHSVDSTRQPAPIYRQAPPLRPGDSVLSIGAGGGVPLKADAGARVVEPRSQSLDWFSATADNVEGASGGGAFDEQGALVGVLARGGIDLVPTSDGCLVAVAVAQDAPAQEQYTYSQRALEGLCASTDSPLCSAECAEPCQPAARVASNEQGGGCALVAGRSRVPGAVLIPALAMLAARFLRRLARTCSRRCCSERRSASSAGLSCRQAAALKAQAPAGR